MARLDEVSGLRSIPASAGEPGGFWSSIPKLRVYPRKRGGTGGLSATDMAQVGLSPQARGNQCLDHGGSPVIGSIPASAGEPHVVGRGQDLDRVYPRKRGGTSAR